jgi:hypothetical protein
MAIFLLIISQALALIIIASLLFTLPRPLNMPVYIGCLVLIAIGIGFALILDNQDVAIFDTLEVLTIITGIILLVIGVGIGIRQRPRIRPFSLGGLGVVMLILTVVITTLEARNDLRGRLEMEIGDNHMPDSPDVVISPTPQATATTREIARQILDDVAVAIARQTGLSAEEVTILLDGGASVSGLIRQHGGDIELVIADITTIMTTGVESMARNGQMDENAASFAIASMPAIVRLGVNSSLNGMLARFDAPESTPEP